MDTPSILPENQPALKPPPSSNSLIPESVKTVLILALVIVVGYLVFDSIRFQRKSRADTAALLDKIQALETYTEGHDEQLAGLKGEISQTEQTVGMAKAELKKTAQQIAEEGQRTKAELSKAISSKADTTQVHQVQAEVRAAKTEAETKIGQVSTEVGGVKTDVNVVKTELASTRRDLEGTQRQLVDVRESLSAAVAKNSGELAALRRKGERDYFEFEIPRKNRVTKVEDIQLVLTKTDAKKGKFNIQILVDDSKLEKKDRTINEPLQFLVGRNRVRYELVVNWVKKNAVGGYLSVPKDKVLATERADVK